MLKLSWLISIFVCCCLAQQYSPVVLNGNDAKGTVELELNEGVIIGLEYDNFSVYRGIPYGTAGRFEMAQRVTILENFNATNSAHICYQMSIPFMEYIFADTEHRMANASIAPFEEGMSENCLIVDLYLPHRRRAVDMGILFWIHGGGYTMGDAKTYSGVEHALQQGNAVAIVQYRLGIMGFFNAYDQTTDRTVGGNYGLGDIALALEFVHENAANIGANPSKILVNGESAGSAATMALLMHEPSVERIAAVVAQSGGTVMNFLSASKNNIWVVGEPSQNDFIGAICGELFKSTKQCDPSASLDEQIKAMRTTKASELWDAEFRVTQMTHSFSPVPFDGEFYKENMTERYLSGGDKLLETRVPMILGWNSFEGSLVYDLLFMLPDDSTADDILAYGDNLLKVGDMYNMFNRILGTDFDLKTEYNKIIDEFQAYAQIDELTAEHHKFLASLFIGDAGLKAQMYMDAIQYSQAGASVYLYEFDFDAAPEPAALNVEFGLSHAGELIYTFGAFRQTETYNRPWAADLSRLFHSTVSDLMNGLNNETTNNLWSPFSIARQTYLHVTNTEQDLVTKEKLNPLDARSARAIKAWKRYANKEINNNDNSFWRELFVTFLTNFTGLIASLLDIFLDEKSQ